MKRRWTGVPAWLDYILQLSGWFEYQVVDKVARFLSTSEWRNQMLDRYCNCEKCVARKKYGTSRYM
jgi:hypothetical protein